MKIQKNNGGEAEGITIEKDDLIRVVRLAENNISIRVSGKGNIFRVPFNIDFEDRESFDYFLEKLRVSTSWNTKTNKSRVDTMRLKLIKMNRDIDKIAMKTESS